MNLNFLRVGLFLAIRQIRRASIWTNVLISFIMTLTFLNLVVVSGILVGLIEGVVVAVKDHYTSDIIINNLKDNEYIQRSNEIVQFIDTLPEVEAYTARYAQAGSVESEYRQLRKETEIPPKASAVFTGIDPLAEDRVTNLSSLIIEGQPLAPDDYDKIIIGSQLLKKYFPDEIEGFSTLTNVEIGSRVRVTVNDVSREVIVKGIARSKVDEIDRRVFFVDTQLRSLIGRTDFNVDEIAIKLRPGIDPTYIKSVIIARGFDRYADVQTFEDAQPKFVKDIKQTFDILGSAIGSIGLFTASITIFILIFINAINRRRYIGILKAVGITEGAIEFSYILQSLFYATIGAAVGFFITNAVLKPYFLANPIDFPFSDGILVVPLVGTAIRIAVLIVITVIAGYIPAKIVVSRKTLDAILGR